MAHLSALPAPAWWCAEFELQMYHIAAGFVLDDLKSECLKLVVDGLQHLLGNSEAGCGSEVSARSAIVRAPRLPRAILRFSCVEPGFSAVSFRGLCASRF
jgi:hypothetical protein